MTIESDTLAVLQKLNTHLTNASRATSSVGGSGVSASEDRARDQLNRKTQKAMVATAGHITALGRGAESSAKNLQKLAVNSRMTYTGLGNLSTQVGKTVTQFTTATAALSKVDFTSQVEGLQEAIQKASARITQSYFAPVTTSRVQAAADRLEVILDNRLSPKLSSLDDIIKGALDSVKVTTEKYRNESKGSLGISAVVRTARTALVGQGGNGGFVQQIIRSTNLLRAFNKALVGSTRRERAAGGGGGGGGGGRGTGGAIPGAAGGGRGILGALTKGGIVLYILNNIQTVLEEAIQSIGRNVVKIIDDGLQTFAARGFGDFLDLAGGGTGVFVGLYKSAITAGMSLQEYAELMDENEGVISRFGTFKEFNEQLATTRDQLKQYGIFGPEATKMAAAMANASQSLGVPMSDMNSAIDRQIEAFQELRKTTGITEKGFIELANRMRDDEVVQKELLGLAPAERAARQQQLMQTMSWGKALGLSQQAAEKLTQALIEQRKSTVKQRFQQRGRIGQALSLVGMDSATIAEAQALASKRMKTPEEEKRFTEIMGNFAQRAEEIKQTGGPGMQFQIETMEEKLGEAGLTNFIDAAGRVRAAQESGAQIQENYNKNLSAATQALGSFVTLIEGISKNPAIALLVGGVGAIAMFGLQAKIIGDAVSRAVGGGGATGGLLDMFRKKPPEEIHGPPKPKTRAQRFFGGMGRVGGVGGVLGAAAGIGLGAMDYSSAEERAKAGEGDGDVGKLKGEAVGQAVGSTAGAVIGGILGSVVPGLGTIIGSTVGAAVLGPLLGWGGKFIGGLLGSESETEKNTRKLEENTKKIAEQNRLMATSSTISDSPQALANLSQTVLSSAKAYSVSKEDVKSDMDEAARKKAEEEKKAKDKKAEEEKKAKDKKAAEAAVVEAENQRIGEMLDPEAGLIADAKASKVKNVGIGLGSASPTNTTTYSGGNNSGVVKSLMGQGFSQEEALARAEAMRRQMGTPSRGTQSSVNPALINREQAQEATGAQPNAVPAETVAALGESADTKSQLERVAAAIEKQNELVMAGNELAAQQLRKIGGRTPDSAHLAERVIGMA